jgi:hypothetical protein
MLLKIVCEKESRDLRESWLWRAFNSSIGVKSPVFPDAREISRLIEAVAILNGRVIPHTYTARNDEMGVE